MATPKIVNRRPDEGDTGVSTTTPFRFSVRDTDTRVDLSTVYCAATFAQAVYTPDADLPATDAVLRDAGTKTVLSMFNDAAGVIDPENPCDQSIAVGPAYRIEKSDVDDVPQEGVLYATVSLPELVQPLSAKVSLDLAFVTAAPDYDYTTYTDFVGVVFGLVYWPENTGVFLLFRDDGSTKRVAVVGPSGDGVGTRPVAVVAAHDWATPAIYTIHVDPTVFSRMVRVYVTDMFGAETLLAEISLDTLNQFLPSTRMGDLEAESVPGNKATLVVGLDAVDQGNYVDILGFSLASLGRVLIYEGTQTGASAVTILPSELIEVVGAAGAPEWRPVGTFEEATSATALRIEAVEGPALYRREEPDLGSGEWLVVGKLVGANAVHPGVYYTGMAVSVEDGTREVRLSLLDNFSYNTVGIDDADADEDDVLQGYRLPADPVDWEEEMAFTLLGSQTRDVVRLYLGSDDETPSVDTVYEAAGYAVSESTQVSLGFVETGTFSGDFYLAYLWVLPNCTFYEAVDMTYPDGQGWSRIASHGTRALSAGVLDVDCTAVGAYDGYYIEDSTYDATSGAALIFKAEISRWTNDVGAASPVRSEFGPIAAIRTSTVAAQVYFVAADDGTTYVYLSNEESDYLEVLSQSSAGQAISAEIDLSGPHVYLLDVKPFQYIRIYLDYDPTPIIDVAWPSSGALRALPSILPSDAVLAWGSLNETGGVRCTFSWVRGSLGKGYDFKVTLASDVADLEGVYSSLVDLVVDVMDED